MAIGRIVLLASLAACGSRSDLLGGEDAPAPIDASVDRAADAPNEAADSAPALTNYGYVIARADPSLTILSLATAVFYESFPAACALAIDTGQCAVATCPSSDTGVGQSAGDMLILSPTTTIALSPMPTPNDGVHYPTWTSMAKVFTPGDRVRVTAAGAVAPGFDTSVIFPGDASITSPSFATPYDVDTKQPLSVAWTQTSAPEVLFAIAEDTTASAPTLICYFDARAGSGAVPSANLAQLKAAARMPTMVSSFFPVSRARVTQGAWRVTINALARGSAGTVTLR